MFAPLTRALSLIAVVSLTFLGTSMTVGAQTVRPAVTEYAAQARGRFELVNETLFPMAVVLEPRGFRVDETGALSDVPFDSANIDLKLSAMSFRIPPRATYTVFYEAKARHLPAWFQVLSAMSGARTSTGLNVRLELPHVVYLLQKEPLRQTSVSITGFSFDSVSQSATVELTNASDALGRVLSSELSGDGRGAVPFGGFPLFPQSKRRVQVPWTADFTPDRVRVRFADFALDLKRNAALH